MWRMLQRLLMRRPRRSVLTRLRVMVEALEDRLVPSASPATAPLPVKAPVFEGSLKSADIKRETKLATTPKVHKSEQQIVSLKESGVAGTPVEPDQCVHGYKWRRPRWPWEAGVDTKYEVMMVPHDFDL